MTEARTVLDKRDQIADLAARATATAPATLESEYEKADADLSKLIETADRHLGAATALAETSERVDASRSVTEKVGLWFAHPSRRLDEARNAFANDDTARATELSSGVQREIDDGSTVGLQRIGVALAILLLLVLGAFVIRRVRRRSRSDADPPPTSQSTPPVDAALTPVPPLPVWTPLSP